MLVRVRFLVVALALSFCSTSARDSNDISDEYAAFREHVLPGRTLHKYNQKAVLVPPNPKPFQGFGGTLSMDSSGTRLVVGAHDTVKSQGYIGAAYVYEKRGNAWKLVQRLTPKDAAPTIDFFSLSEVLPVAISGSGSTILVGYPVKKISNSSEPQMGANLYRRKNNEWTVVKKFNYPAESYSPTNIGTSVSLDHSGKTALLSSTSSQAITKNVRGAAYVFEQDNGMWRLSARLTGQSSKTDFSFGYPAMLDGTGTTMIAASSSFDILKEYVYIFRKKGGEWRQVQRLLGPQPNQTSIYRNPGFGRPLAIDETGKIIAIADYLGNIYTYEKTKSGWRLFDTIRFQLGSGDSRLLPPKSLSMSESGSILAVGAEGRCINCGPGGVVIIYRRENNRWKKVYRLEAPQDGTDRRNSFGMAVASDRSASTLAVSQPESKIGDNRESGHAYIFSFD
eukprot:jgi/Picsp_1/5581/NSC_02940-R1_pkd domain-containing protein